MQNDTRFQQIERGMREKTTIMIGIPLVPIFTELGRRNAGASLEGTVESLAAVESGISGNSIGSQMVVGRIG